jgi:hypothetical protein
MKKLHQPALVKQAERGRESGPRRALRWAGLRGGTGRAMWLDRLMCWVVGASAVRLQWGFGSNRSKFSLFLFHLLFVFCFYF